MNLSKAYFILTLLWGAFLLCLSAQKAAEGNWCAAAVLCITAVLTAVLGWIVNEYDKYTRNRKR